MAYTQIEHEYCIIYRCPSSDIHMHLRSTYCKHLPKVVNPFKKLVPNKLTIITISYDHSLKLSFRNQTKYY